MKLSTLLKTLVSVFVVTLSLSMLFYQFAKPTKNSYEILTSSNKIISNIEDNKSIILDSSSNSDIESNTEADKEIVVTNDLTNKNGRIAGFIKNISEENGQLIISVDEVNFYLFDEAKIERAKDGLEESIVPYYIRNTDSHTIDYKLDNNSTLSLCSFVLSADASNSAINQPVTMDTFKNYVISNLSNDERSLLFWFDIKDGYITNVEMQYTP